MVTVSLLLTAVMIINVICADLESAADETHIVETDSISYIKIDSHFSPTVNTSYGSLQIMDTISITFNLVYNANTQTSEPQNIFALQSSLNTKNTNNYCTQYPSMWLLPNDNQLYFSLLNTANDRKYCLIPSHPIRANIPYSVTVRYNSTNVYISINDTVIINDIYSHNPNQQNLNAMMDTVSLWISNSANPAHVTLFNLYITTPPIYILTNNLNTQLNSDKHRDTIFIIEIAVLTVFCFACLGVVTASLCLLKMRQSSNKIMDIQRSTSLTKLLTKISFKNRFKIHSQPSPVQIKPKHRPVQAIDLLKIRSQSGSVNRNMNDIIEVPQTVPAPAIRNSNANSNSTDIGQYYVQALHTGLTPKPDILRYHSNEMQIPKYSTSTNPPSSNQSTKIGPNSFKIVETSAKTSNDSRNISDSKFSCDTLDEYDMNSDEGDDIKIRRAQIQSQRAVASAFHLEKSESNVSNDIKQPIIGGLPVIKSYETMNQIMEKDLETHIIAVINDTNNTDSHSTLSDESSIEDMFENPNIKVQISSDGHTPHPSPGNDDNIQTPIPNADSTIPPTIPPTFFDTQSSIPPIFPFSFAMDNALESTVPPTIPPTFFHSIDVTSVGPSIPSLATEITEIMDDINNYSTETDITHLTAATKRYRFYDKSDCTDESNANNAKLQSYDNFEFSSSDDLNQLSSGDESTCITVPNENRNLNSNTVSTLSLITKRTNLNNISEHYHSDYTDSPNIQISKSNSDFMHSAIFNNKNENSVTSSVVLEKMKRLKRVLSMGVKGSDDRVRSPSVSDSVSYQNITQSANSLDDEYDLQTIPTYINNDKSVQRKMNDSVSYFEDRNNNMNLECKKSEETSLNNNMEMTVCSTDEDNDYVWIKSALMRCDDNGWETYYDNFTKHKVDEKRLIKLDDIDWRELIPAIGPRNDFKELWRIRKINADVH